MAGPKLDGAGTAKMATLDAALMELQRLHGVVETMAIAVKGNKPATTFLPQIKRIGTHLAGMLKGQFGMISDQITAMLLSATRGGGDQSRLRGLREGVAQVRVALEIAVAQTKEKHMVVHEKSDSHEG
jgi:hypothetical protein